tara:strand:- start:14524 stop:14883 length:360 start_codon:yes stop_codon:yes gene_type:complete
MNKKTRKVLLVANIVLLVAISILSLKMVNGRASDLAGQKMARVCTNIVDQVKTGTMNLDQAGLYAAQETSAGNYTPKVRIIRKADDLLLETNDPSFNVDVPSVKEDEFYVVNCSQLASL